MKGRSASTPQEAPVGLDVAVGEVLREVAQRALADAGEADHAAVALLVLPVAAVRVVGGLADVDAVGVYGQVGIARAKARGLGDGWIERDDVDVVGQRLRRTSPSLVVRVERSRVVGAAEPPTAPRDTKQHNRHPSRAALSRFHRRERAAVDRAL